MAPTRSKEPRAWQRMLSGRRLDLLNPSPLDIEIEDIAHGLSRVARWNGQTQGEWPYSVADHSLLVEEILGRAKPQIAAGCRLAALLHDAPEYVIGDLISPFKAVVGGDYKRLEESLFSATLIRFGLPAAPKAETARAIKRADRVAAYLEAVHLAGFEVHEADQIFGRPRDVTLEDYPLQGRPPEQAKAAFIDRFETVFALTQQKKKAS